MVVGLGAMGSAAAYHLARRGQRVLGLDAHPLGHTLGSSHGETRIIRQAYFEHPNYVPLVQRAYELWEQLEADSHTRLLHLTGGLFIGSPEGKLVSGSLRSAQEHHLPHTLLDAGDLRRRFSVFDVDDGDVGLYEDRAGMLLPERCIEAHRKLATKAGAELQHAEPVRTWHASTNAVSVTTDTATYTAGSLVIAAGAWASTLLDVPVRAERIPIYWFEPTSSGFDELPVWIWEDPLRGDFFGTRHLEWPGVKVGKHHSEEFVDPDNVDRSVRPRDERLLRDFLAASIPGLNGPVADAQVCLYEVSPDTHFIVDLARDQPNVAYAAGFSGHGFKFSSVIGEILADLALTGKATPAVGFLGAHRFNAPNAASGADPYR